MWSNSKRASLLHHKNLSQEDKTSAEFSTLDEGVLVYTMQLQFLQKQPNLKLKTLPKQLLV